MAHIRIRIEEMEYRDADKSLFILGIDEFHTIVSLEIKPVYPLQMAADLAYVARHPGARVVLSGGDEEGDRNEAERSAVDPAKAAPDGPRRSDPP